MGVVMKKVLFAVTVASAMASVPAIAQTGSDVEVEVPPLALVLEGLSDVEVSEVVTAAQAEGSIDADVDIAISDAVSEAVAEGLISSEEAVDATAALEIVASNAEFFDFDILEAIGDVIDSGEFTIEEVRETLEGFNSLSDAGKALVGQEGFDTDPNNAEGYALYQSLSAEDQAIVDNNMPVLDDQGN